MQKIEFLSLREFLGFNNTGRERIPGHNGLDGGKRVASAFLCFQENLANAPI
jgi:hypothetical protein